MDEQQPQPPSEPAEDRTAESVHLSPPSALQRPRTSRLLIAVTAVALLLALSAGVVAVVALSVAKKARTELEASRDREGDLDRRLDGIEGSIGSVRSAMIAVEADVNPLVGPLGVIDELAGRLDTVESDTGAIATDVTEMGGDISLLNTQVTGGFSGGLAGAISALRACVNTYMETVGNSGGGRYTYYFC